MSDTSARTYWTTDDHNSVAGDVGLLILKSAPVVKPSGDTTGRTDTAAVNAMLSARNWWYFLEAPVTAPYYLTGTALTQCIALADNQRGIGCGSGITNVKLVDNSNCRVIRNADPTNGNTSVGIWSMSIDCNGANQAAGAAKSGITWAKTAGDELFDVEIYGSKGTANVEIDGQLSTSFSRRHWVEKLSSHDAYSLNLKLTSGARESILRDIFSYNGGTSGAAGAGGVQIDASECDLQGLVSRNDLIGLIVTNIVKGNLSDVRITLAKQHGATVYGMVNSKGSMWIISDSSQSSSGTYDDFHALDDGLNTYGVSTNTTIRGLETGHDVNIFSGSAMERYPVYLEDGVTGSLILEDVGISAVGTAGGNGVRIPAVASSARVNLSGSKNRVDLVAAGEGLIAQPFSRMVVDQSLAMTTQSTRFVLVGLKAGDVISKINFHVEAAPGTPANFTDLWVGLYKTDGTQLGISADTPTAGKSTGTQAVSLASSYVVPTDGSYYLMWLGVGTSMPQLAAVFSQGVAPSALSGGVSPAGVQTGQSTPPSPATIAAAATSVWLGAS